MGEYCLRLLAATLCGAVLGAERSLRKKDAGIRVQSVFTLASCLFMILSKYAFFGAQGGADPTMIACQIVMGINFMGAGIIFRSKEIVSHGLTTAAGVWATAAIGMACGCGLIPQAVLFTLLILALHLVIYRFNIGGTASVVREMKFTVENTPAVLELLQELCAKYEIRILSSRYKRSGDEIKIIMQVQVRRPISMEAVFHTIDTHKEIKEFST